MSDLPLWSQYVDLIQFGLRAFADFTGSAGLAIVVFTILIKTVLLPLTIKSVRSMYSMQELQPKIKELQKRYGKDRQKISAETMKLYQEHGVNPASGCLPMLIQIPIFFGLYFAVRHLSSAGEGPWGHGFLWIPDLAHADPYKILPILAGIFQLIQTRMSRPAHQGKAADPQQQMMNSMMTFMPLMVVVFGWNFSAGPVIYWVVQAIYSVIQQWFISGWGSMLDWFPFLPDIPEHRRLGYESPEKRAAKVNKGGGFFSMLNKQIEKQQAKIEAQRTEEEPERETATPTRGGSKKKKSEARSGAATPPARPEPRPDLVPRRARSSKGKGSVESD